MLGWSALYGSCDWSVCLPLYAAGISWTLVYDTIYALQDKKDDIKAGVRSTALRFGKNIKPWLATFSASTVGFLALAGYINEQGLPFYLVSVGAAAAHFVWQLKTLKVDDVKDASRKFRANAGLGLIVVMGIVLDWVWDQFREQKKDPSTLAP